MKTPAAPREAQAKKVTDPNDPGNYATFSPPTARVTPPRETR